MILVLIIFVDYLSVKHNLEISLWLHLVNDKITIQFFSSSVGIRNLIQQKHFKYETAGSSNFAEEKHMANKPQQWKVSNRLYNMVEQISSVQIYFPSY